MDKPKNVKEYLDALPPERMKPFKALRSVIKKNLPKGFAEELAYGMPAFVVPHSLYPAGYHCDPRQSLPFISIASQKNAITFYHMGLYGEKRLMDWFTAEYAKTAKHKLDMGKCCVRFKYFEEIPYGLIGELAAKISVAEWIAYYEKNTKAKARG